MWSVWQINGTHVLLEGNTASVGGGLYPKSGATVAVEDGALLEVKGNEATTVGGGVFLLGAGSSLTAKGNGTHVLQSPRRLISSVI